ncbi:MAG TPA: type IV secretion system DNA-binding domain-containing protein [Candidatus Paceibacterota bacterium]|jgi:hypothetical protein|nr:type IV secretion system DNA-binding domain-containing protein [Candidatus Paceibacterota bacterium]HPB60686.1 type IV secretion system DNA-binding domain-containing protein [Candidatus Paceibacterota bacterium]HPI24521.1 type IV secretion system DNA-binding domain-containing protein [Candidatus Paceibacterota bacterium]
MNNQTVNYFAQTDFRGKRTTFGIKSDDRARHFYVIGKTGLGKSTLLENMAVQDIKNGEGVAFIDPHGKSAETLLDFVPPERIKDVIYFAPFDLDYPVAFNIMEDVGKDQRHLVANGLMSTFKKIWPDVWSARMEYILNNTLLALLEYPNSTLLGVNRMLSDKVFRQTVVNNISDPSVKSFWVDEFAKYNERYMQEAGDAIKNKIGQFTSNPLIRNIIGQPKSTFDLRRAMDEKKILIVNLSKGRLGEQNANLLGGMFITKIYLAAMSRAEISPSALSRLPQFYLFVDEFQSFVNDSFADILAEARKYKLCLTIAHQYVEQMPETVRNAVFGNVGSIISFRVGPFDAELLEKIFAPTFTKEDLVNLGFAQIYLTLMIDGVGSPPFSAVTIPPIVALDESNRKAIVDYARKTYAKPRDQVQKEITGWYGEEVGNSSNKKQEGPKAGESKKKDDGQQSFKPFVQVKPPNVGKNVIPKINNNNNVPRKFSLDILRHKPQASGHKEDLKSVLKEILADKKNKKEEPPKKSTEVKKEELGKKETVQKLTAPVEKKQEEKSEKTPMTKNEAEKQEIPQNVLEDILRVDLE